MSDQTTGGTARTVALLTVEGAVSRVLANVLHSAGLLDLIVIESVSRLTRLRRTARRLLRWLIGLTPLLPAIGLRMPPERRVELELMAAAEHRVAEQHPANYSDWPSGVTRIGVDDLNGEQC